MSRYDKGRCHNCGEPIGVGALNPTCGTCWNDQNGLLALISRLRKRLGQCADGAKLAQGERDSALAEVARLRSCMEAQDEAAVGGGVERRRVTCDWGYAQREIIKACVAAVEGLHTVAKVVNPNSDGSEFCDVVERNDVLDALNEVGAPRPS